MTWTEKSKQYILVDRIKSSAQNSRKFKDDTLEENTWTRPELIGGETLRI